MKSKTVWLVLAAFACITIATACQNVAPAKNNWIHGDSGQRWTTVERHLRGLDVAMVEIGYRYQELYWAGVESNWEYADYQLTKLRLSLANALERRPKRRASAEKLFLPLLDDMKRAVVGKERAGFEENFARLTAACNSCHSAESVASFRVDVPTERPSPIRAPR